MFKSQLKICIFVFLFMTLLPLNVKAEKEYIQEGYGPIKQDKQIDTSSFLFRKDVALDLANRYYAGHHGITGVSNVSIVHVRDINDTRDAAVISFTADFSYQSREAMRSFVYLLVIRNYDYTWRAVSDYRTTTAGMLKQHGLNKEAEKFNSR
ncbi:hypothetical protein KAW50_08260 [candidate division WOR-3 bacterium]|nr:hypothetical protein [candidate division WOR-3 bacterium]